MKYLNGEKKLPSAEEMQRQTDVEIEEKRRLGIMQKKYHYLNSTHVSFFPFCLEVLNKFAVNIHLVYVYFFSNNIANNYPKKQTLKIFPISFIGFT